MSSDRGTITRTSDSTTASRRWVWSRLTAPPSPPVAVLCLIGAILLVLSALIHLHLWSTGYRHIPTIGPLFLLQGVVAVGLALLVVATRRAWAALAGAVFAASTIGGLLLSVEVGLFGFKDSLSAPYATSSLLVESVAVVVLATAALVGIGRPARGSGVV